MGRFLALTMFTMILMNAAWADCPKVIPYSIQVAVTGGSFNLSVPDSAKGAFSGAEVGGGAAFVRSTVKDVAQIALSDVLDHYKCMIVDTYVKKGLSTEKRAVLEVNLTRAIDDIRRASARYYSAFSSGNAEVQMKIDEQIGKTVRSATTPAYDRTAIEQVIGEAKINTVKTFEESTAITGWASVQVVGIQTKACGGVLRSALSANAGKVQTAASNASRILMDYLDASSPEMIQSALSRLYVVSSAVSDVAVPRGEKFTQEIANCSKEA